MKRAAKSIVVAAISLFLALTWCVYSLFHGVFDHGIFEIEQVQSFSSTQLAVVAKRSDHQAMSGDQYFVIIGDHPLSPDDLKYAYYHNGVVFRSGYNCLDVRWKSMHELAVTCRDKSILGDEIAVQQRLIGDVTVSYEGIPQMTKN